MYHLFFYPEINGDEMIIDICTRKRPDPRTRSFHAGILSMPLLAANDFLRILHNQDTQSINLGIHVIPPGGAVKFTPTAPTPQPKPHRDTAHG
jgi:hypothetical protein